MSAKRKAVLTVSKDENKRKKTSAVRVAVRVRPPTEQEIDQGGKSVLHVRDSEIHLGKHSFAYDAAYDADIQQEELYQSEAKPLLNSFLDGFNTTVSGRRVILTDTKRMRLSLFPWISFLPAISASFF